MQGTKFSGQSRLAAGLHRDFQLLLVHNLAGPNGNPHVHACNHFFNDISKGNFPLSASFYHMFFVNDISKGNFWVPS